MNAQPIEKDFLKRLKGAYQAKYGFDMDEWATILLYEVSEHFALNNDEIKNSVSEIDKASSLIKGQIRPVHFSGEGQAFYYGLGKSLPYAIAILVIGILAYVLISTSMDYKEVKMIADTYKNAPLYKTIMEVGTIEEEQGTVYLTLSRHKESKGKVTIGKDCFISKNKEKVWIPLQFK